ncbi:MAG: hypothetical protein Q7S22_03000 [Candidatus Micrarchaeota archaeon]|nr:hypothetical protein [Candidatus Micrarchaeota archaeon]
MTKLFILIVLGVLFLGCISTPVIPKSDANSTINIPLPPVQPKCGDHFCAADEYCNTCPQDCGCTNGLLCDINTGICKQNMTSINCSTDQYFDKEINKCHDIPTFNETAITNVVQKFGQENNVSLEVVSIADSYYKLKPVKEVTVRNTHTKTEFIFVMDPNSSILDIYSK